MRIAIVTPWYPSKSNPLYGVFIQNQVVALSDHCSVFVLLMNWSIFPYIKESKEGNVTIIEKGSFYLPNASERFLDFWASNYVRFFKTIHNKHQFDLIHCHDHYGTFVGDKIKNQLSLPYICTIHNSKIMNGDLINWQKAYLPRILNNANTVIAVGGKLAQILTSDYKIPNVKIIPNYIDTDLFYINPTKNPSDFRFLFVGGLESNKGIVELVKAFHRANIEAATLHIVGEGNQSKEIEDYIKDNELEDSIQLYGAVPNEGLPEIYNSCHVLVTVSEYETFGVVVLEAMSCGLSILYTASGGPEEIVPDFAGIKLKGRTIQVISDGLKEIKEKYSFFDSRKIRNHVLLNYGSQKIIGELLDTYRKAINAKA